MTNLTISRPIAIAVPRGAWLAAALFCRLLQALERSSDARAQRRERMARVSDAARVRRCAQQMMDIDPRCASDLFAAADRHDRDA